MRWIINVFFDGFYYLCVTISKGLSFYFESFFKLINKIFKFKFNNKIVDFFKKKEEEPLFYILIFTYCFAFLFIFNMVYVPNQKVVNLSNNNGKIIKADSEKINSVKGELEEDDNYNDGNYLNSFQSFGNISLDNVDFNNLKSINNQVVSWLSVDGTNINYPIVQTSDNEYYLTHNIKHQQTITGWPFMDFENNSFMEDRNTIFYGHNLLNKTSFGSLGNVFTKEWFKSSNHLIIVLTETNKYTYQVFSAYYTDPIVDYLQIKFSNKEFEIFLNDLVKKSNYNYNNKPNVNDKIITLSTCTEDNKQRKVVHAKLINIEKR